MTVKSDKTDPPEDEARLVQVRIAPETERQIAELMPAIAAWARDEGLGVETAEGDVIALAVELMHQQVSAKLADILSAGKAALRTKH